MMIYVNAKLRSMSELNNSHTFQPNAQGLYNVSKLFEVFNALKENEYRANPEYQGEFLEDFVKGIYKGSELFLDNMGDALNLYKQGGEYWGSQYSFELALRSCSDIFSIADNTLQSFYEGKFDKFTNSDYAQYITMKHAIYRVDGNDAEAYRAYCIQILGKLYMDLEFVKDYALNTELFIERIGKERGLSGDALKNFYLHAWLICTQQMSELVAEINRFDPNLRDRDGFMVRYQAMLGRIVSGVNDLPIGKQEINQLKTTEKKGLFGRLFK